MTYEDTHPLDNELKLLGDLIYVVWKHDYFPDDVWEMRTVLERHSRSVTVYLSAPTWNTHLDSEVAISRAILLDDFQRRHGIVERVKFLNIEITRAVEELRAFIKEQQCLSH